MTNTAIILLWLACAPVAYPTLRWCIRRIPEVSWRNGDALFWAAFCLVAGPITGLMAIIALIDTACRKLNIWKTLSNWMSRPARW